MELSEREIKLKINGTKYFDIKNNLWECTDSRIIQRTQFP